MDAQNEKCEQKIQILEKIVSKKSDDAGERIKLQIEAEALVNRLGNSKSATIFSERLFRMFSPILVFGPRKLRKIFTRRMPI